ncbi:MAG: Uncharacterised protein [Owenweeksia sp. TMED14]|mgnify:CR=1 FL=1|nr:MAG: Uncharacterised protein [Owenweeksia sp. TMED14]|tara:strand:+ start:436 stop:600 length:165 start_codon:yes stop_codon:yes gene_type:complete
MNGVSKNISIPERWARVVIALFLIPAAFVHGYFFSLLQSFVGFGLIYNSLSGIC